MKKIYVNENLVTVYLMKAKLEENGIETFIKNESPPLAGEVPRVIAWPELWLLNEAQLEEANGIIQLQLELQSITQKDWKCPQCGEKLEGQFLACWKCGHEKI